MESSHAVELELLEEFVGNTATSCSHAISSDLVLLDEGVANHLSAILRELLVQFGIAFGRSVTLDLHLCLGMILHVRSNQLDGSVLSGIDSRLSLAEEHCGLQVSSSLVLHHYGALQALVE